MPKRSNTKEFIEKATKVHNGRFDYSKVEYVNNSTHIIVVCEEHGEFSVNPNSHLRGTDCPKCKGNGSYTVEDFIKKSKEKFGDFLDYSEVEYLRSHSPVKMSCPVHGQFNTTPATHLQSEFPCPKCSKELGNKKKRKTTKEFVDQAKQVHGDRYDYSLTNYVNSTSKVDIICKEEGHGTFSQAPCMHIRRAGCPVCADSDRGWTRTKWFERAMKSSNFDSFKVYLLEFEGKGEKFYKIGKTFTKCTARISAISSQSKNQYNLREICHLSSPDNSKNSSDMIFDIELFCHGRFADYSYTPKTYFGGYTECFSYIPDDFDFLKMAISLPTNLPTLSLT